jgi:DNA replication protein DnaC
MENSKDNCVYCGVETFEVNVMGFKLPPAKCCASPECVAKNTKAIEREQAKRKISSAAPLPIPAIYRDTDTTRLTPKCAEIATHWEPTTGKGNLLIHGTTRTGKSRTAWYICNRLHPLPFVTALNMREIEFHLAEGYKNGTWHRIVHAWCSAPLLFIDDLGKEKTTEKIGSILFQIIDERTANKLPTIITTNHNGSALESRFLEPETGTAFVARLREFFDTISANKIDG